MSVQSRQFTGCSDSISCAAMLVLTCLVHFIKRFPKAKEDLHLRWYTCLSDKSARKKES
jgi:hypothetical protein